MKTYSFEDRTVHVTTVQDLLDTSLTTGVVFHVTARAMFARSKKCLTIRVNLFADEGNGEAFSIIIPNNQRESIPVQVELFLMELDCLPTWSWWKTPLYEEYRGEFALSRNHKVVDDSGAYQYEVVL